MSKNNVFHFFSKATKDKHLAQKLEKVASQEELVNVANEAGYKFSSEQVDGAIKDLKKQPGFFSALAEAALHIFSPSEDNYPATGAQPFSGELPSK